MQAEVEQGVGFSWARPTPLEVTHRIEADRRIYVVSDLHLGDGTRSDAFLGKDRELMRLLARVREEDAHLVIAGDCVDFHQAWSMSRVLKAHPRLIGELSRLADTHGVTYIWGNHDYDIKLFKDLLRFDVCSSLEVGDRILIQHGYQYDPFIGPNLDQTHIATAMHHMTERMLDSWIRLPLENFYTLPNRVAFWLFHKFALAWTVAHAATTKVGLSALTQTINEAIWYWTQNQFGDPGCLVADIQATLPDSKYDFLVTGHSHLPGLVQLAGGKTYVNTGSWTFSSAQYALWDGERFEVRDWISGKIYGDVLYQGILDGRYKHMSFREWWRENYLGWLRYRVGEEGRVPTLPSPPAPLAP